MSKRSVRPLSSYPPEFFLAWEAAKQGVLCLPFETKGQATNFRARMYAFRKRLLEENPLQGQELYTLDLKIDEENQLVVYVPAWKKRLTETAAKIQQPDAGPLLQGMPFLPPEPQPSAKTGSVLDTTLNNLGFGTENK